MLYPHYTKNVWMVISRHEEGNSVALLSLKPLWAGGYPFFSQMHLNPFNGSAKRHEGITKIVRNSNNSMIYEFSSSSEIIHYISKN